MDRYKRYTPRVCNCPERTAFPERAVYTEEAQYCVCTSQPVSLAMAYVPVQEYKNVYGCCEALNKGTLFADLYKPYCTGGCRR